jgi:hypothetical protein
MDFIIIENEGIIEVRQGDTLIFISTIMEEAENFIKWKLELDETDISECSSCEI